jgi:hypothetical protein
MTAPAGVCTFMQKSVHNLQQQLEAHPAWRNDASQSDAEVLLKNRLPFTYLFRSSKENNHYVISFVTANGLVDHKVFVLDENRLHWAYQNLSFHTANQIDLLTPKILHCSPDLCHSFTG